MATMTDWGEQHEYGLEDQWEYQEENWHDEQAEEAYYPLPSRRRVSKITYFSI
jgi:hypothetical protein